MMDYTKEIERLQKAQSQAAAEQRETAEFFADAPSDMHIDDTPASSDRSDDADYDVPQALKPEVMATMRKGVSIGLLIIAAILLWYAWSGVDDAWDGYYLRPFQAMFVLVPLIMVLALLGLRQMVLQKLQSLQNGSSASIDDIKQRITSTLGWLPKTIMALALVSFGLMFLLPRGLPVGQWLGLAQPIEADATIAGVTIEAATDAVAMDAVKQGDGSVAPNAPKRVGEPTTLLEAVEDGNTEVVKKLIAQGKNVNVDYPAGHPSAGLTLLHAAVGDEDNTLDIMRALIKAGVKVDAPSTSGSFEGFTPLHAAIFGDHSEAVKLLLSSGARMDAADKSGWQALHYGGFHSAVESLPLLIAAAKLQKVPIDVPAADSNGETALMKAAERSFLRGITLLMNAGASLNLVDANDQSAVDYAKRFNHHQAVKLLCMLDKNIVQKNLGANNKQPRPARGC